MRLLKLNHDDSLSLETFSGPTITPYAILSHTWASNNEDEVTFKDLTDADGTSNNKAGYQKLRFCGSHAKTDGLDYFWVDTCCIDKSNNYELTKAINSMFRWYQMQRGAMSIYQMSQYIQKMIRSATSNGNGLFVIVDGLRENGRSRASSRPR